MTVRYHIESVYLYLLERIFGGVIKPTLKHTGRRKWRETEDEPLYKPSIFLYLFLRLKICDINSIPNVKRQSDRTLKIRQYIRYQSKTYIYLLNQKRPELAHPAPLSGSYTTGGYNEPFCNFSAITFLICLKHFCNIYCKCTVCPKVHIKRLGIVFPITPSWKNYQSSRIKSGSLYPTLLDINLWPDEQTLKI